MSDWPMCTPSASDYLEKEKRGNQNGDVDAVVDDERDVSPSQHFFELVGVRNHAVFACRAPSNPTEILRLVADLDHRRAALHALQDRALHGLAALGVQRVAGQRHEAAFRGRAAAPRFRGEGLEGGVDVGEAENGEDLGPVVGDVERARGGRAVEEEERPQREAGARADAAEGGAGGEDDGEVRAEKHGQVAQAVADAHREHGRAEREQRESRNVPGRLSRRSGLVRGLVRGLVSRLVISLVIGLSIGLVIGLGRSGLVRGLVNALGGLCLTNRPTLH